VAVWTLILQSEPEGPALISCAARLLRSDSTFANLLLAPSWRTDLGHLKGDVATVANDLRADLEECLLEAISDKSLIVSGVTGVRSKLPR
jgi:hypothetical protein